MSLIEKLKSKDLKVEKPATEATNYCKFCIDVFLAKKEGYKNSHIQEVVNFSYSQISAATVMVNRAVMIYRLAKERGLLEEMGFEEPRKH